MELVGKIKVVGELETFASGFTKKLLVVTTDDQYPQNIGIEFMKDKIDLLNNYAVGQDVKVSINLGGREWINPEGEAKYFNSVTGWRIEKAEGAPEAFTPPTALEEQEDDLPF
tara:strand:+ start:486 stop:824 length:339 start_codon:yes stop_codon:yes gene_type:complete